MNFVKNIKMEKGPQEQAKEGDRLINYLYLNN